MSRPERKRIAEHGIHHYLTAWHFLLLHIPNQLFIFMYLHIFYAFIEHLFQVPQLWTHSFVNCTVASLMIAPIWKSYSPFLSVSSVPQGVEAITTSVWAAGPQVVGAMGNTVLQLIQNKRLGEQLSLYLSSFTNVFAWVVVAVFSSLGGRWTGKIALNSFLTAKRLNVLLEVGELKWHFWGKSCNYPSSCRSR